MTAYEGGTPATAPRRSSAPNRVLLIEQGGRGGVADYTAELGAALAHAGWTVESATATDHLYTPCAGVRVHPMFYYLRQRGRMSQALRRLRLSRAVNGIAYVLRLPRLARLARQCDIVHLQGGEWPPLGVITVLALRATGRPVIWTPHNTFDRGPRTYDRSNRLQRTLSHRLVLHSRCDVAVLSEREQRKATVIPHGEYGVMVTRAGHDRGRSAARSGGPGTTGRVTVLLFGQLRPDKGIRDLLQAAMDVPEVDVIIAGEESGGLAAAADVLADERLRDRVTVHEGFVPLAEVGDLFAKADVVALPYTQSSASGVLLLAYGCGAPVVAYPVGALPEYVDDGETGWLCDGAEAASLRRALDEIVAAGDDERRRRGKNARVAADTRFSWTVVARATSALYDNLLKRSM